MTRRPARVLAAAILALAMTGVAAQAQSPLAPLPQAPSTTQDAPARAPANRSDTGLEGWQIAAMLGGGVILLAGIGYAIVADARRRAPVQDRRALRTEGRQAPDPHRERVKHRARRKQKQARAQRRRNR